MAGQAVEPKWDAFVSYSSRNKVWVATELIPKLKAAGLRICIDNDDFVPGWPCVHNMERAVEYSRHTLAVLTPEWLESDWTNFEAIMVLYTEPLNLSTRLIPILRKRCELPRRLAILTHLDMCEDPVPSRAFERLVACIAGDAVARDRVPLAPPRADPPPVLFAIRLDGPGTLTIDLPSPGSLTIDLRSIEITLQLVARDHTLKVVRQRPGSIFLDIISSRAGYFNLRRLWLVGALTQVIPGITAVTAWADGPTDRLEALIAATPQPDLPQFDRSTKAWTTVCHLPFIDSFEWHQLVAESLLPPKTNDPSAFVVLATAAADTYYFASNLVSGRTPHTLKIATNQSADLSRILRTLLSNAGLEQPPQQVEYLHRTRVRYLIDQRLYMTAGECELNTGGAQRVEPISLPARLPE